MDKKGFTLVELLVVIAVLGILTVMLLPNVISLYTESQKNVFITEVQQIYKSAYQKFLLSDSNSEQYYLKNGQDVCKDQDELDLKLDLQGRDDLDYYVVINSSGYFIKLTVIDKSRKFAYDYDYRDASAIPKEDFGIEDIKKSDILIDGKSNEDDQGYEAAIDHLRMSCESGNFMH